MSQNIQMVVMLTSSPSDEVGLFADVALLNEDNEQKPS